MKNAFLASEFPPASADAAAFHVIPAPMEISVSYGGGTASGPAAILAASQQLEACDGEGHASAADTHTQPPVAPRARKSPEAWVEAIETRVSRALAAGAVPVVLGGEQIGRASCRERVLISVVAGSLIINKASPAIYGTIL